MKVIKGEKNEITIQGEGEIIIGAQSHKPSFTFYGFDNFTLKEILRCDMPLLTKAPNRKWWQVWKPKYIKINYKYTNRASESILGDALGNILLGEA